MRLLRYYLPPLLLAAIILSAANDHLSSANTGDTLSRVLAAFFGEALPPDAYDVLNYLMRKAVHLIVYGVLGWLAFRALRAERREWRTEWMIGAMVYVIVVASTDEWLQSQTLLRTGSPVDILLDVAGATLAQLAIRRRAAEEPARDAALH